MNLQRVKYRVCNILGIFLVLSGTAVPQTRNDLNIPNIPGYRTLKCDFHVHTVFSDGLVWPTVRVWEAWQGGLDGMALTDHLEYQPHQEDLPFKPNRPYELALEEARPLGILLIRGAEITREMPPGHLNAIFLSDVGALIQSKYQDAVLAAVCQGGFVFWNHPDFPGPENQPVVWNDEIQKIFTEGHLHGIEVANGDKYYPESHRWCLEKKLTLIASSDIHNPVAMDYDPLANVRRPMTLVFAKEKTLEALKEALFSHRTLVFWKDHLIGEEQYLKPVFEASVRVLNPEIEIQGEGEAMVQIRNRTDLTFELQPAGNGSGSLRYSSLLLPARKTAILRVSASPEARTGTTHAALAFRVKNLWVAPETGLSVSVKLTVNLTPAGGKSHN
jgi:hypothetical protein